MATLDTKGAPITIRKKPSRKDLIIVIGELQSLIGRAHGYHADDRDRHGFEKAQTDLMAAHELCIAATSFDEPINEIPKRLLNLPPKSKGER